MARTKSPVARRRRSTLRKSPTAIRRRRDRFATRARAEKRSQQAARRLVNFYKNNPEGLRRDMEQQATRVHINSKRFKSWLKHPDQLDLIGPGRSLHKFDYPKAKRRTRANSIELSARGSRSRSSGRRRRRASPKASRRR